MSQETAKTVTNRFLNKQNQAVEVVDPQIDEAVADNACGTGGFLLAAYDHMKVMPIKVNLMKKMSRQ